MRLLVEQTKDVHIARVMETRMTYPVLASFFAEMRRIVDAGARKLVLDLEAVAFIDSPTIGCLLDLHRLLEDRDGAMKLSGLQPRVQTMLSISGLRRVLGVQRRVGEALALFGVQPAELAS